ncbi:hypothetical protein [Pelagibius marinus]|uniref:hypothetical protein n=1 Tax=Pelagibius marinus TaxID=2762760 RepID=UPI001873216D|nr:hypothetical protein [Pelagibius marinus]
MQLTADQELRRELLLFTLNKQPDLSSAIALAAQMEQFVLTGAPDDGVVGRLSASAMARGAEAAAARADAQRNGASEETPPRERIDKAASSARTNGGTANWRPPAESPAESPAEAHEFGRGLKKRRWSEGDDERLEKLWYSDHSLEEIAEAMGRTTPSLYSRARALGMSKRSPVVEKHEATRPSHMGRTPTSSGATTASASEDDIPGEQRKVTAPPVLKEDPQAIEERRHHAIAKAQGVHSPKSGGVAGNGKVTKVSNRSAATPFHGGLLDAGIEVVIHFLRSRDYSVVRVDNEHFKLDGRRILNAEELREKANHVRQTLGKPPFAPHSSRLAG